VIASRVASILACLALSISFCISSPPVSFGLGVLAGLGCLGSLTGLGFSSFLGLLSSVNLVLSNTCLPDLLSNINLFSAAI